MNFDDDVSMVLKRMNKNDYYVFGGKAISKWVNTVSSFDWDIVFRNKEKWIEFCKLFTKKIMPKKFKILKIEGRFGLEDAYEINTIVVDGKEIVDAKYGERFFTGIDGFIDIRGVRYLSLNQLLKHAEQAILNAVTAIISTVEFLKDTNPKRLVKQIDDLNKKLEGEEDEEEREDLEELIQQKKGFLEEANANYMKQILEVANVMSDNLKVIYKNNVRINEMKSMMVNLNKLGDAKYSLCSQCQHKKLNDIILSANKIKVHCKQLICNS